MNEIKIYKRVENSKLRFLKVCIPTEDTHQLLECLEIEEEVKPMELFFTPLDMMTEINHSELEDIMRDNKLGCFIDSMEQPQAVLH